MHLLFVVSTVIAFTLFTTNLALAQEFSDRLTMFSASSVVTTAPNCRIETNHLKPNKAGVLGPSVVVTVKVCGHLKKSGSSSSSSIQKLASSTNKEACISSKLSSESIKLVELALHTNSVVDTYKLGCAKGKGAFVEGIINPGSGSNDFIFSSKYGLDSYSSPLYCDSFWDYCEFQSNAVPTVDVSYLSAHLDYNNAGQYTAGECY
jgi:hypothetical protein